MKSPVAVIIFNRPDCARELYESLKVYKPEQLFIVSDGPRGTHPGEAEKVVETRAVFSKIDWECKVYRNESDINLGCRERVISGLDWLFSLVDCAIILEDDCIPHQDFFRFASELLTRYEHDTRIMSICGTNIFYSECPTDFSYSFSKYFFCWGWATWKRSWDLFDRQWIGLDYVKNIGFSRDYLGSYRAAWYWNFILERSRSGIEDDWGSNFLFSIFLNHGLNIVPRHNLVKNIGIGIESTHTKRIPIYMPKKVESLDFPLVHPPYVFAHAKLDRLTEDTIFSKSLYKRLLWALHKLHF